MADRYNSKNRANVAVYFFTYAIFYGKSITFAAILNQRHTLLRPNALSFRATAKPYNRKTANRYVITNKRNARRGGESLSQECRRN